MQLRELEQYCHERHWEIFKTYTDQASGSKRDRPGLADLMADVRRRRAGIVLVYRFDRFARSLADLVSALNEFNKLGVDFVSLHEQIDTATSHGRLVFGIMASIAEFERELIRERIMSGLANARAKGKRLGARPIHWHKIPRVHMMKNAGMMASEIAKTLDISRSEVYRLLSMPVPGQDQAGLSGETSLALPAVRMPDDTPADQTP